MPDDRTFYETQMADCRWPFSKFTNFNINKDLTSKVLYILVWHIQSALFRYFKDAKAGKHAIDTLAYMRRLPASRRKEWKWAGQQLQLIQLAAQIRKFNYPASRWLLFASRIQKWHNIYFHFWIHYFLLKYNQKRMIHAKNTSNAILDNDWWWAPVIWAVVNNRWIKAAMSCITLLFMSSKIWTFKREYLCRDNAATIKKSIIYFSTYTARFFKDKQRKVLNQMTLFGFQPLDVINSFYQGPDIAEDRNVKTSRPKMFLNQNNRIPIVTSPSI